MLIIQINKTNTKQKLQHNKKKPNYKLDTKVQIKCKLKTKVQFFELEVMKTQKDVEL
jgi:hypothetical protein